MRILNKKSLLAVLVLGLFSTGVMAADEVPPYEAGGQGSGTIRFIGTVIDAPCSIDQDKTTQEVDFGQVANAVLNAGKKVSENLMIALKDCTKDTQVAVTFSGNGSDADGTADYLGVTGIENAAITMTDSYNNPVVWGEPGAKHDVIVSNEGVELDYTAYLQKSPAAAETDNVSTGDFLATTTFTLAYD